MGSNPTPTVGTADDGQCQETPNAPENKGDTDSDTGRCHAPNTPPIVQADDCDDSANVPRFDKPDDKLSDKRQITDPNLQEVVDAWTDLPAAVRAGIVAMVQSVNSTDEEDDHYSFSQ